MNTKALLTTIISIFTLAATAQIEVGGALAYGTEIRNLGLQARGAYAINEQFDGVFNMTYFFPDKEKAGSNHIVQGTVQNFRELTQLVQGMRVKTLLLADHKHCQTST